MTAIFLRERAGVEVDPSDERLQHLALDELRFDPDVPDERIGVTVERGVVTLTGVVECFVDKLSAQRAAHRVRGVLDIANELEVSYGPDRVEDDAQLARTIRKALESDGRIPHQSVQTTVSHGYVILEGEAQNFLARNRIEQAVQFVAGIRGLRNWIRVANVSPVH